jgi:hypothetical protein
MGRFQALVARHMRGDPGQYLAIEVDIGRMPGRPRRRKTFAGTFASRVARTLARIFTGRTARRGRRRLARPRKHKVALRLYIPALRRLGGSGRPFVHGGSSWMCERQQEVCGSRTASNIEADWCVGSTKASGSDCREIFHGHAGNCGEYGGPAQCDFVDLDHFPAPLFVDGGRINGLTRIKLLYLRKRMVSKGIKAPIRRFTILEPWHCCRSRTVPCRASWRRPATAPPRSPRGRARRRGREGLTRPAIPNSGASAPA